MKCVKVRARDYDALKSTLRDVRDTSFSVVREGDFLLVPVKSEIGELEVVECRPRSRPKTPKLRELVPGVSGFLIIGDIALVTPKVPVDLAKLASSIMRSNPRVKAVFLRTKVEGDLRLNSVKHIGGEMRTKTLIKEGGMSFLVDLAKVYVNPTLAGEREKTSREAQGRRILDAFSGYGPLGLRIAKRGKYVVLGDLNLDGLLMGRENAELNKVISVDLVNYDAHYLPFRDRAFDLTIADHPTMVWEFKWELCRVSKEVVFYVLAKGEEEASLKLWPASWEEINEYSKHLRVFKGRVRCDQVNLNSQAPPQ